MLVFDNVSKHFGALTALKDIHLDISTGRTTVLIGPSGCGKSTLLRLVVGLVVSDSGDVVFAGERLAPSNLERIRRRTGYVIQEGGLFLHLNAAENITLMARYLGWDRARMDARLAELAALVQLSGDILTRYPLDLSGGQRQRVSLMRALMLDPDLLLLDEPLGALDPMIRFELQQDLKRIFGRLGKTVVLVTHDLAEAGFFGDQLVLLRDGQIVQQGSAHDLLTRPADAFVADFVNAQRAPFSELHGAAH
ncbi:MAG: ATP-binding cassette domain-containing protein [Gammaproteobacteria bacterium]